MKKTFRIGEYAYGGVIKIQTNFSGTQVEAGCYDWDTGEVLQGFYTTTDSRRELYTLLNDWTSSYYADLILQWVDKNAKLEKEGWLI